MEDEIECQIKERKEDQERRKDDVYLVPESRNKKYRERYRKSGKKKHKHGNKTII